MKSKSLLVRAVLYYLGCFETDESSAADAVEVFLATADADPDTEETWEESSVDLVIETLKAAGYDDELEADGVAGDKTRAALAAWAEETDGE